MRTVITLAIAVIGAGVGYLGDILVWQGIPPAPALGAAGLLVGLLVGIVLARQTYPRPKRRIDPAQYPNRVIQRR